jgi:hypothetical protein
MIHYWIEILCNVDKIKFVIKHYSLQWHDHNVLSKVLKIKKDKQDNRKF